MEDQLRDDENHFDTPSEYGDIEGWERLTDDPHVYGVQVSRRWEEPEDHDEGTYWLMTVWVAEFLREDPLESELRSGLDRALRAVPGVSEVHEEDREVWVLKGEPSGLALLRAATAVVDSLADRAREFVYSGS